ncbi:tetratricopeptide repeat protein, partial [bacterium]|nr:tetratricopeptide repeat protein [bacterium]
WIEIGPHGRQVRYRQDTPPHFLAVEDGKTTAEFRKDKKTIILYDRNDKQFQWIGSLGQVLDNLQEEGRIIQENVDYRGRLVHKVLWPIMNAECYIDPYTNLPVAIGATELSYEQPPDELFEIVIPEDFAVIDKRPGAPSTDEPAWVSDQQTADQKFHEARYALKDSDYEKAAELFKYVVEKQPRRNWAWFWLAKAHYELGEYDIAIYEYSKIADMIGNPPYCLYVRGLAYAQKEMHDAANEDFKKVLPWMIQALRQPSAASMFEYADDPTVRDGKSPTKEQKLAKMINRLRLITGQNFGYNPQLGREENENAIASWEQWFENSGQIEFTPQAELVIVPADPTLSDSIKNEPLMTEQISEAEAVAIEEFNAIREKIRASEKFEDNSTPLRLYLTILSCFYSRDLAAMERNFALDPQKTGMEMTPALLDKFKYFSDFDVLRAAIPSG